MFIKRCLKIILKGVLFFLGFIFLYWITQFLISKITVDPVVSKDEAQSIEIFILTNGVHTDIVVPAHNSYINWDTVFPFKNTRSGDTAIRYVSIGWGDKGFYMETPEWKDLKVSVAFKAAFGLGASALHITFYKDMQVGAKCRSIMISGSKYQKLIGYIESSIERDAGNQVMHITTDALYSDFDAFYEAHRRYSLFFTCNTWANTALKQSGIKACAWTVFDTPIFDKYPLNKDPFSQSDS